MKLKKIAKKSLSMLLATALAVSGLALDNSSVLTVKAEEIPSTPLSVTAFATREQLMNSFDLDGTDDTVGKVYFGTNKTDDSTVPQTWYIAGSDADDSIVLLCDPELPMANEMFLSGDKFSEDSYGVYYFNERTYDDAQVYVNHYGASDLRAVLQGYTSNGNTEKFSEAEKGLMQATTIYANDLKNSSTYSTTDKLYPAYGVQSTSYVTVGENSANSLYGDLKVSLTSGVYGDSSLDCIWLRSPCGTSNGALVAVPGDCVSSHYVVFALAVVPAFRLNLSSVIFASAATAATSDALLQNDGTYNVYSFRLDGTKKLASRAAYTEGGVTVNYDESDENVYLYVQDADSVYSKQITKDTTVKLSDITGIESLTDGNTKIWLEKSEDNVAYAVMVEKANVTHVVDKDATCEADGNSEYWYFKIGEDTYYFSDEGCSVSIENEPVITKTGHTGGTATCTKKAVCSVCGKEYGSVDSSKHGRTEVRGAKKATCTAGGYTGDTYCKDCGVKIASGTTTETLNHSYQDVKVTKRATTQKDGTMNQKCSSCGKTKNIAIYAAKTAKLSTSSNTYNGKAKKPSVTVTDSKGNKLKNKTDYTVSYAKGRKNVGKYTVTITLKGKYSGTIKKTFTIKPKTTSISKLSAAKKGFTVKWKKQKSQTTGYEIQYSTSSKFTKNTTKTVKITKNSTTSKSITKLKAKKKYYVRVRTYKTVKVNGKSTKIYSDWSTAKNVTTKK